MYRKMLKSPRAPVSGFTPQVRRATPGTAQQAAKDTANSGLEKSREHEDTVTLNPVTQPRDRCCQEPCPIQRASERAGGRLAPPCPGASSASVQQGALRLLSAPLAGGNDRSSLAWDTGPVRPGLTLLVCAERGLPNDISREGWREPVHACVTQGCLTVSAKYAIATEKPLGTQHCETWGNSTLLLGGARPLYVHFTSKLP